MCAGGAVKGYGPTGKDAYLMWDTMAKGIAQKSILKKKYSGLDAA